MAGRGDKGLLITTGTFTADAKREATRDGAPPIDLIDGTGSASCSNSTNSASTHARTVEDVRIEPTFFSDI
jgi:restriction system protein